MKAVAIFALFASLAAANVARAPAPVDCIIESGFDRPGGDYKAEHIETFDACVDACKLDDRCFVVNYHLNTKTCYFKKSVTRQTVNSNVEGAVCRPTCNRDNCFRQLIQQPSVVGPFCQTFTRTPTTTSLPSFASQCAGSEARVSSACSCLHPPSATPTA